jgi:D-methionine transport system substrate-binding protein
MRVTRILAGLLAAGMLTLPGCDRGAPPADADKTIKLVMSDIGFQSDVVPILKSEVAKLGFTLEWIIVNDIIQPNKIVDEHAADANNFQHEPYFEQFVKDHALHNVIRGFYTFVAPAGLFSKKYKSLDQVPDGATFGIPVDPANNGRALFMLRDRGLLQLKEGVDVTHASQKDITANPHHYRFKEVDQLMQQRTLDDVDVGFLFINYALLAGLDPQKDALVLEDVEHLPYRGMVAIHKDLAGSPKIAALKKAFASEAYKAFYREKYHGVIVFLDGLN